MKKFLETNYSAYQLFLCTCVQPSDDMKSHVRHNHMQIFLFLFETLKVHNTSRFVSCNEFQIGIPTLQES